MAEAKMLTQKKRDELLRSQLELERQSFISQWTDLGNNILPMRPRFVLTDANQGNRKNQKIVNCHATLSAGTLRSGMMSGITSPARPWFKLTVPDQDIAEIAAVKVWCDVVSQRMSDVFVKSNVYNTLPQTYEDLGVFGTSPLFIEEDFDDVIRSYSIPVGSYTIAKNYKGKVNTFIREFRMTVQQAVENFATRNPSTNEIDWTNFSTYIRSNWERGLTQQWVDICHVIQPNQNYDGGKLDQRFKRFRSCYYERGASSAQKGGYFQPGEDELYLRESGYDHFPVLCPRWAVTAEDVYGTNCPGMIAIGDIKQLQLLEKRVAQAIEKMINPPMTGPTSLQQTKASILPGDITYADTTQGQLGFRPVHEVNFKITDAEGKIRQIEERIDRCFFADLFLMMTNSDRRQITATEIDERREEKLLVLGPVLEQLNQDLLDPLIEFTFAVMQRQGRLPPPPDELRSVAELKVEYISIMAQAQKLIAVSSLERMTTFASGIIAAHPEAGPKMNWDEMIEEYGSAVGVSSKIIRTAEEAQSLREQAAKAQQMQAASESMKNATDSIKNLSQSDTSGENALNKLLETANAGNLLPRGAA